MHIAREDYQNNEIIICPIQGCRHKWCKMCLQEVEGLHSCDGVLELDELMKEQGWQYCPGRELLFVKDVVSQSTIRF